MEVMLSYSIGANDALELEEFRLVVLNGLV